MTVFERTTLGIYAGIVAIWPIRHVALTWIFRRIDVLTLGSPRCEGADAPSVTAIIPARDEQDALAGCLATVAAQTYPNLRILIVDDRSTDATPAIARALADSDPRAEVVTVADLPPGWTGKTHALHVAAGRAEGDWLWFVDADTLHEPPSLAIAMRYALTNRAALMSLIPRMRCESFWENVVQPLAGVVLAQSYPFFRVNDDRKELAFANGQYILIERSAYDAAGGHAAVRDKFVEDIHLARLVKGSGRPIRVAVGPEISSTRMYASLPLLIRGWSRILYDAMDRNIWNLAGKIVEPLIFSQTAQVALAAAIWLVFAGGGAFAWWLLALSVAHHVLAFTVLWRMYRFSAPTTHYVAWYPLAGLVLDWILLKSIGMCLTGRVTWRGTAYSRPAGG